MNLVICLISITLIIDNTQGIYHKDLLKSETVQSGDGLDPADYFRLKRKQKLKKRKRKYSKKTNSVKLNNIPKFKEFLFEKSCNICTGIIQFHEILTAKTTNVYELQVQVQVVANQRGTHQERNF